MSITTNLALDEHVLGLSRILGLLDSILKAEIQIATQMI